jgi:uncharacterized membrane protein YphA (DoxX/SURF4 family)
MRTTFESPVPSPIRTDVSWLRFGLAFVWLATGLGVLHPTYRQLGEESLRPLGLPSWVMIATCIGEILLGLRVLFGRMDTWLTALQAVMILGFTTLLTATQPALWLHPLGLLTKNLPLLAILALLHRLDRRGWDARGEMLLRTGMAVVWLTDGVAAQFLYGLSDRDLAPMQAFLLPGPALTIRLLGASSAASGVAALVLRGWPRRGVLLVQILVLAAVPVIASFIDPLLWVHPFGPLTKNVPLVIGTWIAFRGVRVAPSTREVSAHDAG